MERLTKVMSSGSVTVTCRSGVSEIGETVFLPKEAAEQALKKLESEDNIERNHSR